MSEPLSCDVRTLDQACLGEQSLFVNIQFVTGVTVTGVTMIGNPSDRMVTPVTFDRVLSVYFTQKRRARLKETAASIEPLCY